jgi:hypothetical protein
MISTNPTLGQLRRSLAGIGNITQAMVRISLAVRLCELDYGEGVAGQMFRRLRLPSSYLKRPFLGVSEWRL